MSVVGIPGTVIFKAGQHIGKTITGIILKAVFIKNIFSFYRKSAVGIAIPVDFLSRLSPAPGKERKCAAEKQQNLAASYLGFISSE